jgi:hypothetical protein
MKKIIIILSLLAFFVSCKKELKKYNKNVTGISFFYEWKEKNVNFLFYSKEQKEVEVKIPLRIQGIALDKDRYYSVSIVKDKTTAEKGIHYKKLDKNKFIFHKNLYQDSLAITLLRTEDLQEGKVYKLTIKLDLDESKDFEFGVREDNRKTWTPSTFGDGYKLQLSIIILANFKIHPNFWKYYSDDFHDNLLSEKNVGDYHYKKVQKFVEFAKIKNEEWRELYEGQVLYFIKKTKDWFREHKTFDEKGNRLWFENKN